MFAFTSWHYRHPPTPPTVKRPYLFRPDHRPTGATGHKRRILIRIILEFFHH